MSYFLSGKVYPNLPIALAENDLDAGAELPDAQYVNDVLPAHDPDWQNVQWQKIDDVWQLTVVDKPLRARIDPVTNAVVELHPTGFVIESLSALDNLNDDQKNLYFDWEENGYDVPLQLRRHIRSGWLRVGESFAPPSIANLQSDLKNGALAMGEEARQAIASPVGFNEVGTWIMNYVGVALHQAGLPTPIWDTAVAIEAAKKGIAPAVLKQTHIAKAQNYHAMAGLIQGMVGEAKAAFTAGDVATLIAESDRLRADAAMADPQAAIAALTNEQP